MIPVGFTIAQGAQQQSQQPSIHPGLLSNSILMQAQLLKQLYTVPQSNVSSLNPLYNLHITLNLLGKTQP
jgi:hypothetical protein